MECISMITFTFQTQVLKTHISEAYFTHTRLCAYHALTEHCTSHVSINFTALFPYELHSEAMFYSNIQNCAPVVLPLCCH